MTEVINLTPYAINILDNKSNLLIALQPSGQVAKVSAKTVQTNMLNSTPPIPISESVFGDTIEVPEPEKGKVFVVSRMVVAALSDRTDLLFPNEVVRDHEGRIIGCKSLSRTA